MRIRLLQSVRIAKNWHPPRAVVTVSDGLAAALIDGKVAVAAEQAKAVPEPPNVKAVLRPTSKKESSRAHRA